jgi:S1-C subfamily serine protease
MVVAVAPDGTSAAAGVEERDWLVALNGQILDGEQERSLLESVADSDDALLLSLLREGRTKLVAVLPPSEVDETDVGSAEVESEAGAGE